MGDDLETRQAEFYDEWITQKSNLSTARLASTFGGPVLGRLYFSQKKQAFFYLCFIGVILYASKAYDENYALILLPLWFLEWLTAKDRVADHNDMLERELIEKWGRDAISK